MKKFLALLLSLLMAFSFATCLAENDSTEKKSISVYIGGNLASFDPMVSGSVMNNAIDGLLFETLLIVDENNNIQPGQAESYSVSEDGLVWTFNMRDDLYWSDGTKLDAKDFEYSFKLYCDSTLGGSPSLVAFGAIEGFNECWETGNTDLLQVKASEDGKVLTIKYAEPRIFMDKVFSIPCWCAIPRHIYEAYGDTWATKVETFIGNGPYKLAKWVEGEYMVFEKNPYYNGGWDKSRILADEITVYFVGKAVSAYAMYQAGALDFVYWTGATTTLGKDIENYHTYQVMSVQYICFNCEKAPLDNPLVRKAISLAIDREYLTYAVRGERATVAYSFVPPGAAGYQEDFIDETYARLGNQFYISEDYEANLEEAKRLLVEAGYPNGEGLPELFFVGAATGAVPQYVQSVCAELGITVTIDTSSIAMQRASGDFHMINSAWAMDYNDVCNLLQLALGGCAYNYVRYNNPEFNEIFNKALGSANPEERFELFHQCEDIIMRDACLAPMYFAKYGYIKNPNLEGIYPASDGRFYLQYAYMTNWID